MTTVSALSTKTIALSLLTSISRKPDDDPAAPSTAPRTAAPSTGLFPLLSPEASSTLMKATQAVTPLDQPTNLTHTGDPLLERVAALQFSVRSTDISEKELEMLGQFGDSYVRLDTPQLAQPEFEQFIRYFTNNYSDLSHSAYDGYEEALAAGTVKFQRSADLPEIGWKASGYEFSKDGNVVGTVVKNTLNRDALEALQATGQKVVYGSAYGQDYIITWPDPAAPAK